MDDRNEATGLTRGIGCHDHGMKKAANKNHACEREGVGGRISMRLSHGSSWAPTESPCEPYKNHAGIETHLQSRASSSSFLDWASPSTKNQDNSTKSNRFPSEETRSCTSYLSPLCASSPPPPTGPHRIFGGNPMGKKYPKKSVCFT